MKRSLANRAIIAAAIATGVGLVCGSLSWSLSEGDSWGVSLGLPFLAALGTALVLVFLDRHRRAEEEIRPKYKEAGDDSDLQRDRKRAELEALRGRARLSAVLENTEDMIFAFDHEYRLTMLNSQFRKTVFAAYGTKLLVGDNLLEKSPSEVNVVWKPRYDRALRGERFRVDETFFARGRNYSFDVSLNPIRENRKVVGAAVFSRNITARKKAEREWQIAKEKAEDSDRLKSAFLANMSHEIRTPLNAIMGFTQLMRGDFADEEERERYAEVVLSNGQHLLRILGDIIDVAQIESDQLSVEKRSFDLNLVLAEALSVFQEQLRKRGLDKVKLVVENTLQKPELIHCDETRLKQILYNLLSNAIKFTQQGEVKYGYKRQADGVVAFHVADTGIGVPDSCKEAIFERFRQADDHLGRYSEGVGLGLSISKGLVDLLGGRIWVEDNSPSGAVFRFTIQDTTSASSAAPQFSMGDVSEKKIQARAELRVLVAEDDDTNFQVLEEFLKLDGIRVRRARDGAEAVRLVEEGGEFDLVLMDISMPVLNGLDATEQILRLRPRLPIVAQTAHVMSRDVRKAKEAGCMDCLLKPIGLEDLRKVIAKLSERAS